MQWSMAASAHGDLAFAYLAHRKGKTTWDGWLALDAHERALGAGHRHTRERVKVVPRDEQVDVSRAGSLSLS